MTKRPAIIARANEHLPEATGRADSCHDRHPGVDFRPPFISPFSGADSSLRCTAATFASCPRRSSAATPAETPPGPRVFASSSRGPSAGVTTPGLSTMRRSRRWVIRRAAALSPRPGDSGSGGRQACSGREASIPENGGLRGCTAGPRPGQQSRPRWRERSLQTAGNLSEAPARQGCHRRNGLCALYDAREATQDGRRLAGTTSRWPVETPFFEEGIHWLHLANSLGPLMTEVRGYSASLTRVGPDTRAKSTMVAFRYDNGCGGPRYSTRAKFRRFCVGSESRSCSVERASSPSSRTERSCWCEEAASHGWCSRASGTSAATGPCIETSWGPSEKTVRLR